MMELSRPFIVLFPLRYSRPRRGSSSNLGDAGAGVEDPAGAGGPDRPLDATSASAVATALFDDIEDQSPRDLYAISLDRENLNLNPDESSARASALPLPEGASYAILFADRREGDIYVLSGPDPDLYWSKCLVYSDWADCSYWSMGEVSSDAANDSETAAASNSLVRQSVSLFRTGEDIQLLESVRFELGRRVCLPVSEMRRALLPPPASLEPLPPVQQPPENCYSTIFEEGPLGIKLKRSADKSVVVIGLVGDSQAEGKGIEIGDALWSIGDAVFGDHDIDEDEFNGIGSVIKSLPRPLKIKFIRVCSSAVTSGANSNGAEQSDSQRDEKEDALSPIPEIAPLHRDIMIEIAEKLVTKDSSALKSPPNDGGGLAATFLSAFSRTPSVSGSELSSVEFSLIKEGRTHIRSGPIEILGKSVLWSSNPSKHIILLSDVLLVTTVRGENYILEQVIENCTCKLNPNPNETSPAPTSIFRIDIRAPGGTLELVFRDIESKRSWWKVFVETVGASMFANGLSSSIGWRHQFIYGTPHSAIMARDEIALRSIIAQCDSGELEYSVLDAPDDDGYTPLHYACIFRLKRISELLLSSHVDCLIPDRNGLNALHWCAVQLDFETLEILCSRVFDVDIPDSQGRTPLYLACVEGRSVDGRTDVNALCKCIELLTASRASVQFVDKMGRSMLHYVAASLQWEAVSLLLKLGAAVNNVENNENQFSALHYACSGVVLKTSKNELYHLMHGQESFVESEQEKTDPDNLLRTVQTLLDYGALPNAKAETRTKTPLLLLIENLDVTEPLFEIVATALVSCGARLDEVKSSKESKQPLAGYGINAAVVGNLVDAETEYSQNLSLDVSNLSLQTGSFVDKASPDTSAASRCLLCASSFSVFKRQHHCRLCDALCCNDCSKKRVIMKNMKEGQRCCDGCFNRVRFEMEAQKKKAFLESIKPLDSRSAQQQYASNRSELLGVGNSDTTQDSSSLTATASVLSEAGERLRERGERLEKLSDKSDKLANASSEFAKLATQLRQQQQQKNSWW